MIQANAKRAPALVSASEEAQVARTVLQWLNSNPTLPVDAIRYELLDEGVTGISMHIEQGAYKTRQFIDGGYRAQLSFSLWYRVQPADSGDARLKADETLNAIADWACSRNNLPNLRGGCTAVRLETQRRAAVRNAWDNGDEDHSIQITLTYEVLKPNS